MSFILDALKKSDSERQRQSGPALFEVKSATPRGGLPLWALILGALLAVNIIALGWFVLDKPAPANPPALAAPAAERSTAQHPVAQGPAVRSAAPVQAVPESGGDAAPAVASMPARSAPVLPPRPVAEPPLPANEAGNPADYEEALPAPEAKPAPSDSGIVPTLEQLPVAIRNQLPQLRLDMHVYATRPADRFVFVNMQRLHEGEATRDGIRVEEITPTGVILGFRGTRFQLERD